MVLYSLRKGDGVASVNELAEQIAAWENDVEPEELTQQQQKRVYVSLYQTHIPKLSEAGVIDYDEDEGMVRLTNRAARIDSYLAPSHSEGYPWHLHYLALTVVGGAVLLLSLFGAPVVSPIPQLWLGLAVTGAFAVSALAHYWTYRQRRREVPEELLRR